MPKSLRALLASLMLVSSCFANTDRSDQLYSQLVWAQLRTAIAANREPTAMPPGHTGRTDVRSQLLAAITHTSQSVPTRLALLARIAESLLQDTNSAAYVGTLGAVYEFYQSHVFSQMLGIRERWLEVQDLVAPEVGSNVLASFETYYQANPIDGSDAPATATAARYLLRARHLALRADSKIRKVELTPNSIIGKRIHFTWTGHEPFDWRFTRHIAIAPHASENGGPERYHYEFVRHAFSGDVRFSFDAGSFMLRLNFTSATDGTWGDILNSSEGTFHIGR